MTREEAIAFGESGVWRDMETMDLSEMILLEELLIVPMDVVYSTLRAALGRPVYTHELARPDELLAELRKERPPRTLEEILALLPENFIPVVIEREKAEPNV